VIGTNNKHVMMWLPISQRGYMVFLRKNGEYYAMSKHHGRKWYEAEHSINAKDHLVGKVPP
jgi:hypothetical protein